MKKLIALFFILQFTDYSYCQIGIGTTSVSEAAMLEVNGNPRPNEYRGFMPSRVPDETSRDAITMSINDTGLTIFVIDTGCLDIFNGTDWEHMSCTTATPEPPSLNVWINEFHYDIIGVDTSEFIELAGVAGTQLLGYSIVRYDGNGGLLPGNEVFTETLNDDTGTGYGFITASYPTGLFQNNTLEAPPLAEGFALVDASNNVLQLLSYEGVFTALNGPAVGLTSTDISVAQTGNQILDPVGSSLQLTGTGSTYSDFTWSKIIGNTTTSLNTGQAID